jgi:DNA-binding PadR family transcriptional regulator
MTGYEIQQLLQQAHTDQWAEILPGSIYHALKKMEKEGLVRVKSVTQTGHRTKAIYEITSVGETEYLHLLKKTLMHPEVPIPKDLYTALAFIDDLSKNEAIQALKGQIVDVKAKLEEAEENMRLKQQDVRSPIVKTINANILNHYRLHIQFLEILVNKLNTINVESGQDAM